MDEIPAADHPAEVELLLPHAMLIPQETPFNPDSARKLLAANGTPAEPDETVVACESCNGTVAIVAVNDRILQEIRAKCPDLRFSTPLSFQPRNTDGCVWLCLRGQLLFAKVYRQNILQFAQVVPAASPEEIAYFVDRLAGIFPIAEYGLLPDGDDPRALRKEFGKRFGKILSCE